MYRLNRPLGVVLCLVAVVAAAWGAPSNGPWLPAGIGGTSDAYTLQGVVKVARPNSQWIFESDPKDPGGVALVNPDVALQIVFRWAANNSEVESKRAAALLMSRLMRAKDSTGKAFSPPRSRVVAGQPASSFTVEHVIDKVHLYRTQYVLVSHGKMCLVVAISGGVSYLDKFQKDIEGILSSIAFVP